MEPVRPVTSRGHQEPFAVQFSIFLANRVGQLHDLLDVFAEKKIRPAGLSIVDSADWAVVRVVVLDANLAREVLKARGVPFTESEVLLAELTGEESLAEICEHLTRAELNIHFAYPLTYRNHGNAVMVLHVDDRVLGAQTLTRHGFVLLGDEDLADPV